MKFTRILLSLLASLFLATAIHAQSCTPAPSLTCEDSHIQCGFQALDGLSCQNYDFDNPTGPSPSLCFGTGVPFNTQWWGFYGDGDRLDITIEATLADCAQSGTGCTGIQAGIVAGCGQSPLDCNANCNSSTIKLSGVIEDCYNYYLWVDGCCGDVCPYTITLTHGGGDATIPDPTPTINFTPHNCPGFYTGATIDDLPGCNANYQWSLGGQVITKDYGKNWIEFKMPIYPTQLCYTWYLGDSLGACDSKQTCITVEPNVEDKPLPPKFVCYEDHRGAYTYSTNLQDTTIYNSCINPPCTIIGKDKKGCYIRYIQEITLLPERAVGERNVFVCDGTFRAENGRGYSETTCGQKITWPAPISNSTIVCDTSYVLNLEVYYPDLTFTVDTLPCFPPAIRLHADFDYFPQCIAGDIIEQGFWLTPTGDTIWDLDLTLNPENDSLGGTFRFMIKVDYTDLTTPLGNVSCHYNTGIVYEADKIARTPIRMEDILCLSEDTVQFKLHFTNDLYENDTFDIIRKGDTLHTFIANDSFTIIQPYPLSGDTIDSLLICKRGIDSCCTWVPYRFDPCIGTISNTPEADSRFVFYRPSFGVLDITNSGMKWSNVDLYDINGRRLYSRSIRDEETTTLSLTGIPNAVYIAVLTSKDNKRLIYRFVKR